MNLPPTFFYEFFKENTFFVIENMIYNIKVAPGESGIFFVGKKKFGINEGLTLSKLEEIYFSHYDSKLKNYGNNVLKKILEEEKDICQDYHKLGQEIEFVEFALYKLLNKGKKSIKKAKILNFKRKNSCLINKIFNNYCFVRKGKIYRIKNEKKNTTSAKINNKYYNISESLKQSLETLEKEYIKNIKDKIYNQLTKGKDSLFNKIQSLKEKKDVINLINKGDFYDSKEDIGFKKGSEGFFITKKVKPYILYETENKKHYRFGEATLGVKLVKKHGELQWQEPVVINPYIHPAIPNATKKPFQKICRGKYDYKKATEGKNLEESVRILLGESKRMLLSGYYGIRGAWHFLTEKPFQILEVKEYYPKEVSNR